MNNFFWGFLAGMFSGGKSIKKRLIEIGEEYEKEHSTYIPQYSGCWKNNGSSINENWIWKEPKYKHRYINIFIEEEKCIINVSWRKKQKTNVSYEYLDQSELELWYEHYENLYSISYDIEIEHEGNPCTLSVMIDENEIRIILSKVEKEGAYEVLCCFDEHEALDIYYKMLEHYSNYRYTTFYRETITPSPSQVLIKKKSAPVFAKEANYLTQKLTNDITYINTNPFLLANKDSHKGLVTKVIQHVTTKEGELCKSKWIKASEGLPNQSEMPEYIATSYLHNYEHLANIAKSDKNDYPVRYCPLSKLKAYESSSYVSDPGEIKEITRKYHAGIAIPVVRTFREYEVLYDSGRIVEFAINIGLTHVPIIALGYSQRKKQIEEELSETITLIPKFIC